jgi:hypothetical protein
VAAAAALAAAAAAAAARADSPAAPLVVLDVPFVAQTEATCGGAAAAMLLRYWGVADVQAEDFAPLIDARREGIPAGPLAEAIAARGLEVRVARAGPADLAAEIASGRPVLALVDSGGGRRHWVVVIAFAAGRVLVNDPAAGPYRLWAESAFRRSWSATNGLALLAAPSQLRPAPPRPAAPPAAPAASASGCDALVDDAVRIAGAEPAAAARALAAAAALCPADARPRREIGALHFRQERWREAADAAQAATRLDPGDTEAWRLLAASRFLADEPRDALAAWNRVGEPRLDTLRLDGLARTRHDVATGVAGLPARGVLTPESVAHAERRLAELPSASSARLAYRPRPRGWADVVASVAEPGLVAAPAALAVGLAADVAQREARLRVHSPTRRGERLELGGRFLEGSPALWAQLETPRLLGLPGVVSLSALGESQSYDFGAGPFSESRRRGAVDWADWPTATWRLGVGIALDRFQGGRACPSARVFAERRFADDHVALLGDLAGWRPLGSSRSFGEGGVGLAARSSTRARLAVTARLDARRASAAAPLALWPGAGTGTGRPLLLRASPLRGDGAIDGEAFGRGLVHATVEAEVRVIRFGPAALGAATFADWARAWDRPGAPGAGPDVFAIGGGLRLWLGGPGALRLDAAHRPGGRGVVVSAGWLAAWPR